jgi:hypothetical protein
MAFSSAVLNISAISTNDTDRSSASSSNRVTPSATPSGSTDSATAKCTRMLRCVRTT